MVELSQIDKDDDGNELALGKRVQRTVNHKTHINESLLTSLPMARKTSCRSGRKLLDGFTSKNRNNGNTFDNSSNDNNKSKRSITNNIQWIK